MNDISASPALVNSPGILPLSARPRTVQAVALLLGTLFLAISSRLEVPMVPVPITMQTFAVMLVGALFGWRLGTLTILAWFGEAILGLPVLAGGASGAQHFFGPTGGYLFAFPIVAGLIGWLAERGWTKGLVRSLAVMIFGSALILAMGGVWLARLIGPEKAMALGVTPFILGDLLKSALATAVIDASRRLGILTRAK